MKFGPLAVDDPELVGAILAHSIALDGQKFKKGRVLSRADGAALRAHHRGALPVELSYLESASFQISSHSTVAGSSAAPRPVDRSA